MFFGEHCKGGISPLQFFYIGRCFLTDVSKRFQKFFQFGEMAKHRDFLSWQLRTQNLKPHSRERGNPVVDTASRQQTWIPAFAGMTEMDETMIKTKYFIKTAPLSGEFFGGPFKAVLLESGGKAIWIFSKIEDV